VPNRESKREQSLPSAPRRFVEEELPACHAESPRRRQLGLYGVGGGWVRCPQFVGETSARAGPTRKGDGAETPEGAEETRRAGRIMPVSREKAAPV
jgi:hypothetical protein